MNSINKIQLEPQKFLDPKFWTSINPALHVEDKTFLTQHSALRFDAVKLKEINSDLVKEGYFQLEPQKWQLPISLMAEAVKKFVDMGWPTVFALVYDEFFLLPYCVSEILSSVLGKDFKQLPDFWAWYIDPLKSEGGWKPHRDKGVDSLTEKGEPKSLTVWIPLTDATSQNGCMYILPANWDPYFKDPTIKSDKIDYHNIRALPANAGSVLGWNQAILHWGGRSSEKIKIPRISVAFEFQRGDVPPYNSPFISVNPVMDLKSRVQFICKQILQYKHMYPLSDEVYKATVEMLTLSSNKV
ncbi:MAG: phytanoyl-CoA dioxygenase family protein [Candidatus Melainabacteria bacterium]|nr:phytanoyl-CoA dioxygenase family protein [Candidatus Melainabacteria bacterium]